MSEWISVEERLPVVGQEVEVRLDNGTELRSHRNYAGAWVVPRDTPSVSVVCWRYLPYPVEWTADEIREYATAVGAGYIDGPPPDTAADAGPRGEINRLAQLVLDELKINVEGKSVSWGNVDKVAGYLEDIAELSEKLAADAGPRAELGRELIAWAADEKNILADHEVGAFCIFCDTERETVGYIEQHAPDCLHLRARALEAGDDAQTD